MRGRWITLLGLGIVAVLFWWLFRNEEPADVWNHIRGADFRLLIVAAALTTTTFPVRAIRWRYLLEPSQSSAPFRSRFAAVCIGFMANNLVPRSGEFARAYAYSRREPVTAATAFATLVVERFLDGTAILILLIVALLSPGFPSGDLPGEIVAGIRMFCVLLAMVLAASLVLLGQPERSMRAAGWLAGRLLPARLAAVCVRLIESFAEGLESLRGWRLMLRALAWSLVVWGLQSLSLWTGFLAFDIHLPFDAAFFTNASAAFASMIPTPGFLGTFHTAVKLALADLYGVPEASSLGFAFGWHLGAFFPITFMGLWYARSLGLSLRAIGGGASE